MLSVAMEEYPVQSEDSYKASSHQHVIANSENVSEYIKNNKTINEINDNLNDIINSIEVTDKLQDIELTHNEDDNDNIKSVKINLMISMMATLLCSEASSVFFINYKNVFKSLNGFIAVFNIYLIIIILLIFIYKEYVYIKMKIKLNNYNKNKEYLKVLKFILNDDRIKLVNLKRKIYKIIKKIIYINKTLNVNILNKKLYDDLRKCNIETSDVLKKNISSYLLLMIYNNKLLTKYKLVDVINDIYDQIYELIYNEKSKYLIPEDEYVKPPSPISTKKVLLKIPFKYEDDKIFKERDVLK